MARQLAIAWVAALTFLWTAGAVGSQEAAKLKERIDALQRDLGRISRALDELRAQIDAKQNNVEPKVEAIQRALDQSYQALFARALDRELLVKASRAFDRGEIKSALSLLRRGRDPAAVPLILKDMLQREARTKHKMEDIAGHVQALSILTGEDVESAVRKFGSMHRLAAGWWQPRQKTLTTDMGKMSPEQLAQVARGLRDQLKPVDAYRSNGPSYYAHALLYKLVYHRHDGATAGWYAEELHPALGPVFLAGMGYRAEGARGQDIVEVPYPLAHLLAEMRKNGALPKLDAVARDAAQNSGLRLVCLIALQRAGEGVAVSAVLSILAKEKNLDRKLAALELLYYADDLEPAADYLLEALDHPNAEVHRSVLHALGKRPPLRLFKRLAALSNDRHDEDVLEIIAAIGTTEAQQYLADYLARSMKDGPKTERIHDALWAFQHSVNQSWVSAGSYTFEQYHAKAAKALEWWKANGPAGD